MPTLNTLPATPLPDLPLTRTPEYNTDRTQYGDGYVLVAEDGINAKLNRVSLSWTNVNDQEAAIINAFLDAHAPATPFYYTAPGHVQRPYICTEHSTAQVSVGFHEITASLEEYHGVTV